MRPLPSNGATNGLSPVGSSTAVPGIRMVVLREESADAARAEFELDVLEGLSRPHKSLSSVYFYDDIGSVLYQKITELEEYYPTRCEQGILQARGPDMIKEHFQGDGKLNLIELGAGDGRKTRVLIHQLLEAGVDFEYVPIDISRKAIEELTKRMAADVEHAGGRLQCHGIVADNAQGLKWLAENKPGRRNLVLFLGSSIGNFDHTGARKFLRRIFQFLKTGDKLLIGCDMKKDPAILVPAYNDKRGVTRDFNINLLRRMNLELGADFSLTGFYHMAAFNPHIGAMESWLVSKTQQTVHIDSLNRDFHFDAFEALHTEYSHKYTEGVVKQMAVETGFVHSTSYFDGKCYFLDAIWTVPQVTEDR